MSGVALLSSLARALRVFVATLDPARAIELRQKVAGIGHELAPTPNDADVVLSDLSDGTLRLAPGGGEHDEAGSLPYDSAVEQIRCCPSRRGGRVDRVRTRHCGVGL